MRLENKVAVITGAGSGIGRASALRFAAEGAQVMAIDVNKEGLDETGQIIADAGLPIPSTFAADVSQSIQVRTAIERCFQDFGRIDVVFSNAAVMLEGSVIDLPEAGLGRDVPRKREGRVPAWQIRHPVDGTRQRRLVHHHGVGQQLLRRVRHCRLLRDQGGCDAVDARYGN